MRGVRIRHAVPEDLSGVRELLTQMPDWRSALRSRFVDENIVAVDESGLIVGWLNGNHVSTNWQVIDGYEMAPGWRCSYINWLLVDDKFRGHDIGPRLVRLFARDSAASDRDTIIASPQSGDDEQKVLRIYSRLGFRRAESGHVHTGPHGPQDDVPLTEPEVDANYLEQLRRHRY